MARRQPQANPAAISASAQPTTGTTHTIGTPPAPYAGGQVASGERMGVLGNVSIFDIPFNETSYTEEFIRNQQARSLRDVLDANPSIRPDGPVFGIQDSFIVRGFFVNSRDFAFDGLYGITNDRKPTLENIERVEYLAGPSAFLYGFSPNGQAPGFINLIPKRATDNPIAVVAGEYLSKGNVGASFDAANRVGDDKEFGVRITGRGDIGDTPIDKQSERSGSLNAALDYRNRTRDFRWTADFGVSQQHIQSPTNNFFLNSNTFAIPKVPSLTSTVQQSWESMDYTHYYGTTRTEYDINNAWTLYAAYGASHQDERDFQALPYLLDTAGNVRLSTIPYLEQDTQQTGEAGVRGQFYTGPLKHAVSLSGTVYHNEIHSGLAFADTFNTNLYNPLSFPSPNEDALFASIKETTTKETLAGEAIVDTISYDDRVFLGLGGRHQHLETSAFSAAGVQTGGTTKDADTPYASLLMKPVKPLSLYASYAESFGFGPTAPVGSANATQVLDPARTKQSETGAKLDLGNFGATLAFYEIVRPSAYTDPTTKVYGYYGEQRNRGMDLNIFGTPIERVRLLGGVTLLDGVLTRTINGTNNGHQAIGVPHVSLNLGAEYDPRWIDGFTVSGRVVSTTSTYADAANFQKVGGYTRLDLGARYKWRQWDRDMSLRFNVTNVTGVNYWYAEPNGGNIVLGSPRIFRLSWTADLLAAPPPVDVALIRK